MSEFRILQQKCREYGLGPCSGKGINTSVLRARIDAYEREQRISNGEEEVREEENDEWKRALTYTVDMIYMKILALFEELDTNISHKNIVRQGKGSHRIHVYGKQEEERNIVTTSGDFILVYEHSGPKNPRLFIDFFFVDDFNPYSITKEDFERHLTNIIKFSNNMEWLEEQLAKDLKRSLLEKNLIIHDVEARIEDFRDDTVLFIDPQDEMEIHTNKGGIAALVSFVIVMRES